MTIGLEAIEYKVSLEAIIYKHSESELMTVQQKVNAKV